MKRKMAFRFCILLALLVPFSCTISNKRNGSFSSSPNENQVVELASPPVIVYKTRNDYFDKVPVILSDDKTQIVSFPAPFDLKIDGNYTYPTALKGGYLLDNRGINQNAAFLKYSYKQYCELDKIPGADMLFNEIIDFNPFSEIYQCGCRGSYHDIIAELDSVISSGRIVNCSTLIRK